MGAVHLKLLTLNKKKTKKNRISSLYRTSVLLIWKLSSNRVFLTIISTLVVGHEKLVFATYNQKRFFQVLRKPFFLTKNTLKMPKFPGLSPGPCSGKLYRSSRPHSWLVFTLTFFSATIDAKLKKSFPLVFHFALILDIPLFKGFHHIDTNNCSKLHPNVTF